MAYNVRERVALYEYGASGKTNENDEPYVRNVVGAFMTDYLRIKNPELVEYINYPTETMIIEFLYGNYTKMGMLIIEDIASRLVYLCNEERWDESIKILQDIVDGIYD